MVSVSLIWHRLDWRPKENPVALVDQLHALGVGREDLFRSVYVIRLNGNFCIQYPNGTSPTVYVGEGDFPVRIKKHAEWLKGLSDELMGDSFQVCVALPRVRKNENAYMDTEAVLIQRFIQMFGIAPLWNKQKENRKFDHHEYVLREIDEALCKRSGSKYKWAVMPLKSSQFFSSFPKGRA